MMHKTQKESSCYTQKQKAEIRPHIWKSDKGLFCQYILQFQMFL